MNTTTSNRQYARFQSQVARDSNTNSSQDSNQAAASIEDALIDNMEVCTNCIEPIPVSGPVKPATFIYVDSLGSVQQRVSRPTSNIFNRFMPRKTTEPIIEPIEPQESTAPSKKNLFEALTEDLSKKVPLSSGVVSDPNSLTADEIENIVQKRVEERLKSISSSSVSLDTAAGTQVVAAEKKHNSIFSTLEQTFVPFFNNELYTTYDCSTVLSNNSELKLQVELAGLLSSPAVVYPFGNQKYPKQEYSNQRLDFTWSGDDSSGMAKCQMTWKDELYSISFDRIVKETKIDDTETVYEEIKFEEIPLPAIFKCETVLKH
jgi:hypothetical protein